MKSVLAELEAENYRWVPVGGILNNSGAIDVGADPAETLNERITNAIDAVLEREWREHYANAPQPATPREAAERWFKIPHGRLSNLSTTERRRLAEKIRVTLLESGVDNSPTISVVDDGIGQHPSEFANTLLSLQRDNKIDKHFLMGAYGQGGAAVYAFCQYTVVISRRQLTLLQSGQRDQIGWTVVRYNPLDVEHKNGRYEYLVTENGAIPTMDADGTMLNFPPGTNIRLIQYQLPKHSTIFTAPSRSLWALTNMVLYDPVMPFLIGDERLQLYKKLQRLSSVQRTRPVMGNANRLREKTRPETKTVTEDEEEERTELRYDQEHTISMGEYGSATVRYWIFDFPTGKSRTPPVDAYSDSESAIAVTLNGQRQGKFDRTYFRNPLNLPIMKDYMLVQIDCDNLSKLGKRALFSSTRDRIKRENFLDAVLGHVNAIIAKDAHVKAIAADLQEAALQSASTEQNIRLSRKLVQLIEEWELRDKALTEIGRQMLPDREGTLTTLSLKRKEEVESEEQEVEEKEKPPPDTRTWTGKYFPTEFDFVKVSDPLRIPLFRKYSISFRTDAQNDCLTREHDRGELKLIIDPPGGILERSRGQMRGGMLAIIVEPTATASAGDNITITGILAFQGRTDLVASRKAILILPHRGAKKTTEIEGLPKYQIIPVHKENDAWKTDLGVAVPFNWTEEDVADVGYSDGNVLIYINMSNADYIEAVRRRNLSEPTIRRYSDRYKLAIAFHAYMQDRALKEIAGTGKAPPTEETLKAELQRTVRTVIYSTFVAPEEEEMFAAT